MRQISLRWFAPISLLLATTAVLQIGFSSSAPKPDGAADAGLELARLARDSVKPGGRILLISRDTTATAMPAVEQMQFSFEGEIRRMGLLISARRRIRLDPLRAMTTPSGDFLDLLRKAGPNDVVVSFLGPVLLNDEQKELAASAKAAAILFCPGTAPENAFLRSLLSMHLVQAAVVSRTDPRPGILAFSNLYEVITQEGLNKLSTPKS